MQCSVHVYASPYQAKLALENHGSTSHKLLDALALAGLLQEFQLKPSVQGNWRDENGDEDANEDCSCNAVATHGDGC